MSQNNPLRALLDKQDILLLDGAMATELEARGCNLADSLWSAKVLVENPELIREVHLDYYRGGGAMRDHCQLSGDAGGLRRARSG
ncbi:homocysteine S-methyltransferase (S-methylmethionine:homocysteine methyltransferase) [Escherichia coli E1114]|nr:homocysteine S-methyltransferase (S-methylmethionine:homocysteine methyltransferase) [Escherichia coli E1114]